MNHVLPLFALLAVGCVVVGLLVWLFRSAKRENESETWPSTQGTIQLAGMETVGTGRSAVVLPCFAFSYVVNGEYYSGRFSLSGAGGRSANLIKEMVDKKLTARYDPNDPSKYAVPDEMIEGYEVGRVLD